MVGGEGISGRVYKAVSSLIINARVCVFFFFVPANLYNYYYTDLRGNKGWGKRKKIKNYEHIFETIFQVDLFCRFFVFFFFAIYTFIQ